jgi:hypothetical protein
MNQYEQYQALAALMAKVDPLSGEWHGLAVARDRYARDIRRDAVQDCVLLLREKLDELDEQDYHTEYRAVVDSIRRIEGRLL